MLDVMEVSSTSQFNQQSALLKKKLEGHQEQVVDSMQAYFGKKPKFIILISLSNGLDRARVFTGVGNSFDSSWHNAISSCRKHVKEQGQQQFWMKADLVSEITTYTVDEYLTRATAERANYWREGIAIDDQFGLVFLEEEVHANMFIKRDKNAMRVELHINNMNYYLKHYRGAKYEITLKQIPRIHTFHTISYFSDGVNLHALHNGPLHNGRRNVTHVGRPLVFDMISQSSAFLANQVKHNGKFEYGHFPCFDRPIKWYNMLRHASTTYSMIEAYALTKEQALIEPIQLALHYLVKEGIRYVDSSGSKPTAFVVDWENEQEIKLGANAAAILALSKYTTVFKTTDYNDLMTALANGIAAMENKEQGGFIHVLNYPDLSVKQQFRIVYYDGEAAFALMRLYAIDKNEQWLQLVERTFEYFIRKDYWKHHDHWLSYCTNELTQYRPHKAYFQFGLNNVMEKLDFIEHRDTTYPTFLELLMAAYKMVDQIEATGMSELLELDTRERLKQVIEVRALHQLNGFFFPETAMYFKSPHKIAGAFYIRHHSFRVRIDDVEHNISGYCQLYESFLTDGTE